MLPFRPEPVGGARRGLPKFQRKLIATGMKKAQKRNKRLKEENDRIMKEFNARFAPPSRWTRVRLALKRVAALF